ncbi:hypothetical protein L6R29_18250 [Myxococcota bacterium]|nr:hypothetical protein [Myxococcota bacterium]
MNRIRTTKLGQEVIPREETEEYKFHKAALEAFHALSDKEKFETFVRAGIYTQDGKLTEQYGGTAPNPIKGSP